MVRLATAKLRMRNRREVEHRVAGARLVEDEEGEAGDRRRPAAPRPAGRPSRGSAARSGRRPGPPSPAAESAIPSQSMPRKASGSRLSSHRVQGERHGDRDQRDVDPEDRPPGERLDQGAAAGRAEHGRDPGPGGPGADRLAARRALEGGGDDRQRARAPAAPRRSPAGRGRRSGTRPSGATAQRIEVAPKAIRPMTNIRRRPNWSPSEPPTSSSETSVSM